MVKRDLVSYIIFGVLLILAFIGLRLYVFEPYSVTAKDANQVIRESEQVVAFRTVKPQYGDLVLYKVNGKKQVSRVVGKPGDEVTYMDDVLYLNNAIKEEPYLETMKTAYHKQYVNGAYFTEDFSIQSLTQTVDSVIPKRQYLLLNDDRTNSEDSRQYGLINKKDIIGVISFRFSPLSEFGFVDGL